MSEQKRWFGDAPQELTPTAQAVLDAAVKQQVLGEQVEAATEANTYTTEMGAALSDANDELDDAIRRYREEGTG